MNSAIHDRKLGQETPRSPVQSPVVIDDADDFSWDYSADVVIAGFGGAGTCAALELLASGAQPLVIDRFNGGGATAFSGGLVYAGGTTFLKEAGFDDDHVNMARYLALEVGDAVSAETLRKFCEDSADNLEWLRSHGVKFGSKVYQGKTGYPPEGFTLQFSGNEKIEEYSLVARPVPRGHRAVGRGFTGEVLYAAIRKSAEGKGLRTLLHSTVNRLVADRSGRIVGVEVLSLPAAQHAEHQRLYDRIYPTSPFKEVRAELANAAARKMEAHHGVRRYVRGVNGVILATGGFIFNVDLLGQYAPPLGRHYSSLTRLGSLGDSGSAVLLGKSVGAAVDKMDKMFVARVQSPPAALLDGILVNARGERFANESIYAGSLGSAIVEQPEAKAWMILTRKAYRKAIWQILTGGRHTFMLFGAPALLNLWFGGTKSARTAEQLATKCGIDPAGFAAVLQRYAGFVARKRDEDFMKLEAHLTPLGEGPFVAVNVSLDNKFTFLQTMTLGGLQVDEETGAVKRGNGSVIAGLYAAGRAAVGLPSNRYISGLSIADCVFSGRRAARACLAAEQPVRKGAMAKRSE